MRKNRMALAIALACPIVAGAQNAPARSLGVVTITEGVHLVVDPVTRAVEQRPGDQATVVFDDLPGDAAAVTASLVCADNIVAMRT